MIFLHYMMKKIMDLGFRHLYNPHLVHLVDHLFFYLLHIGDIYASSSSTSSPSPLSSELEFYLRNDLQSALDETQIENLDVLG